MRINGKVYCLFEQSGTFKNEFRKLGYAAEDYPTPPDVTQALLDMLDIPKGATIWEPACGAGDLARVLSNNGYKTILRVFQDRRSGTVRPGTFRYVR